MMSFHDLMKYRVTEILLVSTPYDGYVLEEDGKLSERLYTEYVDLSIHFAPRVHRVTCALEAFTALKKRTYHLIITMSRISDMDPFEFARKIKDIYPEIPVVMLSYERLSPALIASAREDKAINRVFYWAGDSRILVAIIKYIEDQQNVEEDSKRGVQVILVVEDSPLYYSQFLPLIYTEILKQTRYLVSHALSISQRLLRVRARPKIQLAETYEEALAIIEKYRYNLLGLISDVGFPKNGKMNEAAGLELAWRVRKMIPDLPFLLQSSDKENEKKAKRLEVSYLDKNTPSLLLELRSYIMDNYGFGAFVFRNHQQEVLGVATDVKHLERLIREIPDEILYYHASNNHFSRWFRARTEFETAEELKNIDANSFSDIGELRACILEIIDGFFRRYQTGKIIDFGLSRMDIDNIFIKLGTGSLGGKARGVAFFNYLLTERQMSEKYPGIKIKTPRSFVICSEVFEQFIEDNNLYDIITGSYNEEEIAEKFLSSELNKEITENLRVLLQNADYPLAVRSSSLLEDSQLLPFAGIYKTYILPNNHPSLKKRLRQLTDAVKLIYASVFYASPKQYAKNADIRIEEEKMAVLIQELVGEQHGEIYYPLISGVAQSYNFYPYSHLKPEDGIVSLVLGFGKAIVEGEQAFRFSPRYPQMNPPYAGPAEFIKKSQNTFYVLNLKKTAQAILSPDDSSNYEKHHLTRAADDQVLQNIGSTYSVDNDCIIDNIHANGPKLITFAPILKQGLLPLNDIIKDLLEMGKKSFGCEVEIEFALNVPQDESKAKEFYFLQIRPMIVGKEPVQVKTDFYTSDEILCTSKHTIGNGIYDNLYDLIFVDPDLFDLHNTVRIAEEIGELNRILLEENRMCILIGFGRLGTSDRWLGIPLNWSQMSQARVVIEADRKDLQAEPSQGSHFYHNLISLNIGYLHIRFINDSAEWIDWQWLTNQPALYETRYVKLIRSSEPFQVKIDGRNSVGIILKPGIAY